MSNTPKVAVPFSLVTVEKALSAKLGMSPIHVSTRVSPIRGVGRDGLSSLEVSYRSVPRPRIEEVMKGLSTLVRLKPGTNPFVQESGHWVNTHPEAPFHIKARVYQTGYAPLVFTITPLVTEARRFQF